MAQFDVHDRRNGPGYLLDCQHDILRYLDTRFVIPLLPLSEAPSAAARFNPIFDIGGEAHMLATQFAASVERSRLGSPIMSLGAHATAITNAIDHLIGGY